ncbi:transposase [Loktanella sp. R86503]|uniref:IS66-like element accessory protein TnpA n=1 Tax=Loktanella sp. R86503 TaxID=3093847 RepID=UPI0036DB12F1
MARRTKRLWTDEEKRSICLQTTAPDVSVAQVARRYALNANVVFKWLRDPRFAPDIAPALDGSAAEGAFFLPVEIVDRTRDVADAVAIDPVPAVGIIEIDIAGGHRLRISGVYDPEALARLIRGLSA